MLKKSISLLLSVFVLTQSLNIHLADILGLQDLIDHMQFHQDEYGDGILAFVAKHYGDGMLEHKGDSEGDNEHQKLPFNHHRTAIDQGHVYVYTCSSVPVLEPVAPGLKKAEFYYYNLYFYMENSDIFQPPRAA